MTDMDPFDELCARLSIVPEFHDIWGNPHRASDSTRRALLAAMGFPVQDEQTASAALLALERAEWSRLLPPVHVVRPQDGPWGLPVTLPAEDDTRPYQWRLEREDGSLAQGEFLPQALPLTARKEVEGLSFVRRWLSPAVPLPEGYHRFAIAPADGEGEWAQTSLIAVPSACYVPEALRAGRAWGFNVQLYAVRSQRNWGMGDFGDLARLVEFAADHGASALLLNPLHPLFPSEPAHASPYSPSNRAWFNTLYLDVEAIPEFHECSEAKVRVASPEFAARLAGLRAGKEVDYATVARAKAEVLDLIYRHFRTHHLAHGTQRAQAFRAFQAQGGESLRAHALFEALQAHFHAADPQVWGWPAWPAAYRDPASPEVAAFAERAAAEVEYFEYLQWQAAEQLARAGQRSWQRWLRVGLMFDLAIGVAEGGAATWAQRDLYALSASIGAPPDEINRMGQDWGLPPWIPHRLREAAYAPFIELLRANMREAGALRIDHVMGLYRLYWVPRGQPASEGAYVRYPFDDLLGILALESQRNRCMVVGEDLGTVPDEVRAALAPMGVFSTRLLYFEREADGSLKPPGAWPENAVVAVTTHDLPTLAGFWQGLDIELRARLALFPDQRVREEQVRLRAEDRKRLLLALEEQGLLPVGADADPAGFPRLTPELAAAVYLYLARAPARLLLVQMEDAFGMDEQANLPGTTWPAYPCWRSRLPVDLESWDDDPWLAALVAAARQERP